MRSDSSTISIPVVSTPFAYYAYSLVGLIVTSNKALSLVGEFFLWSGGTLVVGVPVNEWRFGVNLVAVAALLALARARRPHSLPEKAGAV